MRQLDTPCWEWAGNRNAKDYGRRSQNYVHRLVYAALVGPLDPMKELHHVCENPPCCNPDHLEQVTRREHQDLTPGSIGPANRSKTHCPEGHPYDDSNTFYEVGGRRRCRTCVQQRRADQRKSPLGEAPIDLHRSNTCKAGHDLTEAYIRANGTRQCRECAARRARERRAAL